MRQWLAGLTQPEDRLLWAWIAIVAGYAAIGLVLGFRARRRSADREADPVPDPSSR